MATTSVLIGSRPSIPTLQVTVTVGATQEDLEFVGGDYYLSHGSGSLSLLQAVVSMLNMHSLLVGSAAFLTRSGRVRLTNASAFSIDAWGSSTILRDLLGFTAALVSSTAHVAPQLSPLYWAPGKTESPRARVGSDGTPALDTYAARSAPGRVVATTNNQWSTNALLWRYVKVDRYEQVPAANGTYATFWDEVLQPRRRFYVARNVVEDPADTTTAMSLSSRIPATLPYIWRAEGPDEREHRREIDMLETYGRVDFEVETAGEYA